MNEVLSPCTGKCLLDRRTRWCVGCGRTASEIARWPTASTDEKMKIGKKLSARLLSIRSGKA
ncbi:MAG: DUF1289 domain-containing protein [Sphingomonadaceae bacterium]|nr:DUF1289 domain-containing protein [Rhizobiaceae bacterium]MCL4672870.1 DUF1289 domain-containing protein [Sphingomonadaceae bacterium]